MKAIDTFKMPNPTTINGRSSSITNAFINGVIPTVKPTDSDVAQALKVLGMTSRAVRCAYCGDKHQTWDHLNPLIKSREATGYFSEINNLVPACNTCNSSKGNRSWREWIEGAAKKLA